MDLFFKWEPANTSRDLGVIRYAKYYLLIIKVPCVPPSSPSNHLKVDNYIMKNTFFFNCKFKEEEDLVKKGRFYREVKRNFTNLQGLYYETGRWWHPTALHINLCSPTKCPSCFYLPFQTLISSCFLLLSLIHVYQNSIFLLQLKFLVSIRDIFYFSILWGWKSSE